MDINEARKHYIFTCKIELDDDDYIVLREPTSFELKDFDEGDGKKNFDILQKLFPKALIEHNFMDGEQPAKNEKVSAFLMDSGTRFIEIIETWMESLPFKQDKKKLTNGKSDK